MKAINTYINEKLKINKSKLNSKFSKRTKHTLFPETKEELLEMIKDEIDKNGNECSLNHIDTSKITDMSELFNEKPKGISPLQEYYFNCDISEWDVSNVTDMSHMFSSSHSFNQDISEWDVSNVKNMNAMFYSAKSFNQDISRWDVSNVTDMGDMFSGSNFNNDSICKWDVSNVRNMKYMFSRSNFNQDISMWKINPNCNTYTMCCDSKIKKEFLPQGVSI